MTRNEKDFCSPAFLEVVNSVRSMGRNCFTNVYIYITEQCQLRCKHCYLGKGLRNNLIMPKDKVFDLLAKINILGGKKLSILGGEPTLHKDFEEIITYANSLNYDIIAINTNAAEIARKKLSQMSPNLFSYIQVSLDGPNADINDFIRGKGAFNEALKTIQMLCDKGFDTRIIYTVNRQNMEGALALLPQMEKMGVSLFKYHIFSDIGNGKERSEWALSPTEWMDFYARLKQQQNKYKLRIQYQPTFTDKCGFNGYVKEGHQGCIGCFLDRLSVFPNGRAYVCSYLFDTDMHFAEISPDNYFDLNMNNNEFTHYQKTIQTNKFSCPAEKILNKILPDDILPVCRLWKSEVR